MIVTEIPYQVQKSQLIEQIAELLEAKKLPLLADIRDESRETVRIVLEPKSRSVEPEMLMETLFRATPLESRFPLNMNVLTADRTPVVMACATCCAPGSIIATKCWNAARATGSPRSSAGWKCSTASRRVPQPRRGDPHHPRGGRTEAAR